MLKIPDNQVAGHEAGLGKLGPLIDDSGCFYKPLQGDERGSNEVAFYASFSSNTKVPDHIRKFFPEFHGTQLVEASDKSGLKPHLVLQDLTFGRSNPSIVDIKIGSRTWAHQASADYIQKCMKKDQETSSLSLGFRLSGLQVYEGGNSRLWKPGRKSIKFIPADEVKLLLRKFVSSNAYGASDSKPDCSFASVVYGGSSGILSQLLELKSWFEDQTIYHFYACSILMTFESELASSGKNPRAEIKLIDFAHVFEGKGIIDHNFLGGLCSLIKVISEVLTNVEDYAADVYSEDIPNKHTCTENGSN